MIDYETLYAFGFNAEILACVTGWPYSPQDLEKCALRIIALERLFHVREGITRDDDTLPLRLLTEPMPEGPKRGQVVDIEPLKYQAYEALGWDKVTGIPSQELLLDLGMSALLPQAGNG